MKSRPKNGEEAKWNEHDIFVKVFDTKELVYTDQTRKFPHMSSKGHQ